MTHTHTLRLHFCLQDMIIRGGENISPAEVEEFLYHHPKIQEVEVLLNSHAKLKSRSLTFRIGYRIDER
jgi:acyl-CoA synthetase (AMP-forming)/AMP-acid ligase II